MKKALNFLRECTKKQRAAFNRPFLLSCGDYIGAGYHLPPQLTDNPYQHSFYHNP